MLSLWLERPIVMPLRPPSIEMQPLCQFCDPYYKELFITIEVEYLYKSLFSPTFRDFTISLLMSNQKRY